jgi:valyl-tRNA synthetase
MTSKLTFWVKNLTYNGLITVRNIELKWVLGNDIEDLENIIGFVTGMWTDDLDDEIFDQLKEYGIYIDYWSKNYTMQSLFQRDFVYDHIVKLDKGVYEIKWST